MKCTPSPYGSLTSDTADISSKLGEKTSTKEDTWSVYSLATDTTTVTPSEDLKDNFVVSRDTSDGFHETYGTPLFVRSYADLPRRDSSFDDLDTDLFAQ